MMRFWSLISKDANHFVSENAVQIEPEWNFNVTETKKKQPILPNCWECSQQVGRSARYCPKCGADQRKRPMEVPWWLLITLLIGVIAFVGLLSYAATREDEWHKFERELRQEYGP